jgi:outer membrane receptor for Fe3+-dicitrate
MKNSAYIILACLASPWAIRADEPTVPAPTTVAAAADTAPETATNPPANVAAEKTPAQLRKEAAEETIRRYGVNGYKPETTKSGDVVYCKMEAPVGSRFETKQCRTFNQLRDNALNGKEFVEQLQRVVPPNRN